MEGEEQSVASPRSRRMGIHVNAPPPPFDLTSSSSAPDTPKSATFPTPPSSASSTSSASPGTPTRPPRSPLRPSPSPRSVSSFATLLEHYTKRDTSRLNIDPIELRLPTSLEEDEDDEDTLMPGSASIASLSALLEAYANVVNSDSPPTPSPPLTPDVRAQAPRPPEPFDKPLPSPPSADSDPTPLASPQNPSDPDRHAVGRPSAPSTSSVTFAPNLVSATPSMSKREHALHELLNSERAYASDLAFIRNVHMPLAIGQPPPFQYPTPLTPPASSGSSSGSSSRALSTVSSESSASSMSTAPPSTSAATSIPSLSKESLGPPMTEEDRRIIFGNVPQLAIFADTFATRLEDALGDVLVKGTGEDHVGKLLLELIPQMEGLYKTYITRHPIALSHLNSLPQTPALAAYLQEARTLAASITHAWDIPSLLIKPVQRLLKYPLILTTIIVDTADDHPDKKNLILARRQMEEIARRVNEGRRRLEVVQEILMGGKKKAADGGPASGSPAPSMAKKKSANKGGTITLSRVKSMGFRITSQSKAKESDATTESEDTEAANEETARVQAFEQKLKQSDAFLHSFASSAVSWSQAVRQSVFQLRAWATEFGKVIGLDETHSEAFDAFVTLIDDQLLPLCGAMEEVVVRNELLPQLGRLLDTTKGPKRLFQVMRTCSPLHQSLLNFNIAKTRPPASLMDASQSYIALRGQLDVEMPGYLTLLDKGIVCCIRQFAHRQTQFWHRVRDTWAELWDALRLEGETNAGCEETLRLWWERFREVDEAVHRLITVKMKRSPRRHRTAGRTRSASAASMNMYMQPPASPSSVQSMPGPSTSIPASSSGVPPKHRSMGSMDGAMMQRSGLSVETPERYRDIGPYTHSPIALTHHPPEDFFQQRRPSVSSLAQPGSANLPGRSESFRQPTRSTSDEYYMDARRGRQSRSPSLSRRLSDSLRTPLRRSDSQKSMNSLASASAAAAAGAIGLPNRSSLSINTPEVPPLPVPSPGPSNIVSGIYPDSPALYAVTAIHQCEPPTGVSYLSLPFFELRVGDVFEVLSEAGPPSSHDGIPLFVDEGEDCLLVVRSQHGDIGWVLASFLMPLR